MSTDKNITSDCMGSEETPQHAAKYNPSVDTDISGFQNVNQFLKHLPYFEKIKANTFAEFDRIRVNLAKALVLNEIRPGVVHWTNRLQTFINEYGLFFTKENHLQMIKIFLEIIFTENIDLAIVDLCFSVLVELLKKYQYLSRESLVIDWRPIYRLYLRIDRIDERSPTLAPENIENISFLNFVSFSRIYFAPSSTAEILAELRPLLCPFDLSMNIALERCNLFLPTIFMDDETESESALNIWIKEFLDIWLTFSGKPIWETNLISLVSRAAKDTVGIYDWTAYIPYVFSKTLRGLGLPLAAEFSLNLDDNTPKEALSLVNTLSDSFAYTEEDIDSIGTWIVSMIANSQDRSMCMRHLKRLFSMLGSYYYPSNTTNLDNFFCLLQRLPEALIERVRLEKLNKSQWLKKNRAEATFINDQDIEEFVLCLRDIVLIAIFSKTNFNDAIKTFQYLCFLRSDLMLPLLIDKLYNTLDSLTEPHRYTSLLACLTSVPRELVSYNDLYPSAQKHVIQLLCAVLPGIDINDLNKFILTFQFLTNVFGNILVCDCSAAVGIRNDLTDHEKELCSLTQGFDDFISKLFSKLFTFVDHLANDPSSESSLSDKFESRSIFSRNNLIITDENVTQVHVLQMLRVLINQSSKSILKQILSKVLKYINGRWYSIKSGDIIACLCGYLVSSGYGKEAFYMLFECVYENLIKNKDGKNFNHFLHSEKGEGFIKWNLHLLSYLLKADGLVLLKEMSRINELFSWYKSSINKECISHLTACFNNLIASLTKIYPRETCSVGYSIIFEDEVEFFSKHLPIRDWGLYIKVSDLNVDFHLPCKEEIAAALELVGSILNESISFLRKSMLYSRKDDSNRGHSKILKEENYRELNYVYHVVYGSSCLLKRPSNRQFISEHCDSNVDIGLKDDQDKGLGFELANVEDTNHEYSQISSENKNILLHMRETVIEFINKLAEKLIDDGSNDTILLILISRILSTACSTFGMFPSEFDQLWNSHFVNKSTLQNKLILKKYPRDELIKRVTLQYAYRCFHLHTMLNDLDFKVINILVNLAINSFYEIVRQEARIHLFELLAQYPYSAMTILPKIIKFLNKTHSDKKFSKEQLEGCLLLLKGNNIQTSMLIKQNWFILSKLWPALFKCKFFEKDTVQKLLDKIYFNTNLNFNSFDNKVILGQDLLQSALNLSPSCKELFSDEKSRLKVFNQKASYEGQLISKLMDELINIARDPNIMWKNQEISLFTLIFLLNSCQTNKKLLTEECVESFVDSLVHENINFRKIGIDALCIILKMMKHKKQRIDYQIKELINEHLENMNEATLSDDYEIGTDAYTAGYRVDNKWHLYDQFFINENDEHCVEDRLKWERTKFLDKTYWGYYCWPSKISVSLNQRETYPLAASPLEDMRPLEQFDSEDFGHVAKPIRSRFQSDAEFVEKFIKFSLIEEARGNEKFDKKKVYVFKALFRNFGSIRIVHNLMSHLHRLVADRNSASMERGHKLAAEIICGLIKGSKHWLMDELKSLYFELKILFDLVMDNLSCETINLWIECFSLGFVDKDPRRMTFYLNYFKNLIFDTFNDLNRQKTEKKYASSLKQTNRLQLLACMNQFEWRIPLFWDYLTQSLFENMDHPNKSLRELLPRCSILAVINDIDNTKIVEENVSQSSSTQANGSTNLAMFIDLVEKRLKESIELYNAVHGGNDKNRKELQRSKIDDLLASANFFQTLLNWLIEFATRSLQPLNMQTLRLIPLLCRADNMADFDRGFKMKLATIRMFLAIWSLDRNCQAVLIEDISQIIKSNNWHTRVAGLQILKNFAIFNTFQLDDEIKQSFKRSVVDLLTDDQLDVRLSACLTLTGFFHTGFVRVEQSLIGRFKKRSKSESSATKRHGGVLGLCAIVNASAYDVPAYLPEVVTYLCSYINDCTQAQNEVKNCLNQFRRTHLDNWEEKKRVFSQAQLDILSDTLTSLTSYYA